VVLDNSMYGTIRMHQERHYPRRVSATRLRNPDFAALGRDFGGYGERIVRTEDFAPAFERALSSGKPAISVNGSIRRHRPGGRLVDRGFEF
jgi:acetolactate synthase-1/2/3 large subunit